MPTEKKAPSKWELIEPTKGDKAAFVAKTTAPLGKPSTSASRLAADRKHPAKTKVPKGHADRGDVKK